MNKNEPYSIATKELLDVEEFGFDEASKHVGTTIEKQVASEDDIKFDIELVYDWLNDEKSKIKITCKVTSTNWYRHEQLEESITMTATRI